jgi:hypothetical protein
MRLEPYFPEFSVELTYGEPVADGYQACVIGEAVRLDSQALESYLACGNQKIVYDCLLLAAAVDYADHSKKRAQMDWARKFRVRMPVHDVTLWSEQTTQRFLRRALELLTGDIWNFEFYETPVPQAPARQQPLPLEGVTKMVVPFSDGLDSRAVSAIIDHELGEKLVRVRLSSRKIADAPKSGRKHMPFTAVPFRVSSLKKESSGRSRGFKYAIVSGLAAYLSKANRVAVPESGQGAIGPALVNVGQAATDWRTHPRFTYTVSEFLGHMLGTNIIYEHPVIWNTKGQTVAEFHRLYPDDDSWARTRSCWQSPQKMSIDGHHRQCGMCAACLLRRLSLHAAGLQEADDTYVWQNLGAPNFWDGADAGLSDQHKAYFEYGLAGVLHLDHLAHLQRTPQYVAIAGRQALLLSKTLGMSYDDALCRLEGLLDQHASEWNAFLTSLPATSFIRKWTEAS